MGSAAAAAASEDDHGHRAQGRSPSPCPEPQDDGGENTKTTLAEEGRVSAKAAMDPSPASPDTTVSGDGRHQFLLTSPTAKPASHPEDDGGGNDLTSAVSLLSLAEAHLTPCKSGPAPRAADPPQSRPGSAVFSHHHQESEPEEDGVAWDNKRTHCRFLVSDDEAGLIIGVRGCTVAAIEASSRARVKLSRRNELLPGTDRRVILVSGTFQQVMDAMELLLEKLLIYQDDQVGDSEATVVLVVPQPCCGQLIGKGGAVIGSLTEVSEAVIQVSPQETSYGLNDRLITITGPMVNQLRAIFLILFELLEQVGYSFTYADAMPNTPMRSPVNKDALESLSIAVADEYMGVVIGRGGRRINEISKVSGAWIEVSGKGEFIPGTQDREVTISGTSEAIRAAEAMIMRRVSVASGEFRWRRAEGGSGKGGGGGGEKLLSRLEEDEAVLQMRRLQLS